MRLVHYIHSYSIGLVPDNDPKALEQVRHAISSLLTVPLVKTESEYVDL